MGEAAAGQERLAKPLLRSSEDVVAPRLRWGHAGSLALGMLLGCCATLSARSLVPDPHGQGQGQPTPLNLASANAIASANIDVAVTKEVAKQSLRAPHAVKEREEFNPAWPSAEATEMASYVKPVELRFSNDCFVRRQRQAERRLLEHYAASQPSSQLSAPTRNALLHFQEECTAWVTRTTDAVWHAVSPADQDEAMDLYFTDDFASTIFGLGMGGAKTFRGKAGLKENVHARLKQIPDLKIRALNSLCTPAVHDSLGQLGFFTTMPDISMGHFQLLDGTSRPVLFFGTAVCFVILNPDTGRWQYRAEMVIHDDMTMMAELQSSQLEPLAIMEKRPSDVELFAKMRPYFDNCSLPVPYYGQD